MTTWTKAWTLGNPRGYERAVVLPGNAKAPGGYAFPTVDAARRYMESHVEAWHYRIYPMWLPGTFEACTTAEYSVAAAARHQWHQAEPNPREHMPECGVCVPRDLVLDCHLLTVEAPFIEPDAG